MTSKLLNRSQLIAVLVGLFIAQTHADENSPKGEVVRVQRIWDTGAHNAFTDLVRLPGKWICVFREGKAHVSPEGAIRIITSTDGTSWKSSALIHLAECDLRDPKIVV